jgi:hypothetical protein
MRKFGLLATVVLLAVVLLTSGVGTAAEPQKNQILVPVKCDNGQSYTFVINGMSKVGQIIGDNNNIVVTKFTVTYRNPDGSEEVRTFEQGKAEDSNGNSPQGNDALSCTGSADITIQGPGDEGPRNVRAVYEFEGFVTPRGE